MDTNLTCKLREGLTDAYTVTDSAKLANIIPASGYNAIFRPTADCVEAAITGRISA